MKHLLHSPFVIPSSRYPVIPSSRHPAPFFLLLIILTLTAHAQPEMMPRRALVASPQAPEAWYAMWDGSDRADYEWDAYPTYEAYETMMQQYAAEHPDRCTYMELGTLASGRKLMFCRINNGEPDGKPKFLYTSTMHGNELTGMMLMLRLLDELCTSDDPRILNLMNNLDIFISPNTNPDGTYHGGNHTVAGARRHNANDVDLNRNYPDFDNGPHPDANPYQDETLWMMDLAREYPFTMAANFHTGSEVMNYPWDTYQPLHPDDEWWQLVCHEYADLVHQHDTLYMSIYDDGIVNGYVWYPIWGSRQDYMNYYAQCREVTIECSSAYTPNPSLMPMYWTYNHESMLRYMEQCLNGIHGTVTDSITGSPLEASVFIEGHDHHGSSVSSHLPAGDYHRPIKGGTYDITFSCRGYFPKTLTLTVADGETLVQDVQLVPTTVGLDECCILDLYPNPTSSSLVVITNRNNESRNPVITTPLIPSSPYPDYLITNLLGQTLMSGILIENIINVSSLPNGIYFLKIKNSTTKFIINR